MRKHEEPKIIIEKIEINIYLSSKDDDSKKEPVIKQIATIVGILAGTTAIITFVITRFFN